MVVLKLICVLPFLGIIFATSLDVDKDPKAPAMKSSPTSKSVGDKSKNLETSKSAASQEEIDKARTHNFLNYILNQGGARLYNYNTALPYGQPVFFQPTYSAVQPSYGRLHAPFVSPVAASGTQVAPAKLCATATHVAPSAPVAVSTTFTKPVVTYTPQVVQKPSVAISQHVVHRPVVTEYQNVIRRPVIAEVIEVVHKPVFTEYQQVFKPPLATQHILKPPTYNAIKQESYQPPLQLNSQQYHVVDKPQSQVLQLPAQYIQPYTNEIIHVPTVQHQTETATTLHVPAIPAVSQFSSYQPIFSAIPTQQPAISGISSYLPGLSSAVSSIGSYPTLSSGFPYYPASNYGYGVSGIGSSGSYSYGSYSGGGGIVGQYLTPSLDCRSGECMIRRYAEEKPIYQEYANEPINYRPNYDMPTKTPYVWSTPNQPGPAAKSNDDDYETIYLPPNDGQQIATNQNNIEPNIMKAIADKAMKNPSFLNILNDVVIESMNEKLLTEPKSQNEQPSMQPKFPNDDDWETLQKRLDELEEDVKLSKGNKISSSSSSDMKTDMKPENSKSGNN